MSELSTQSAPEADTRLQTAIGPVDEAPAERQPVKTKPMKKKAAAKKASKKQPKAKKPKAAKKAANKAPKKKGAKVERKSYINDPKMLTMHARILKVLKNTKDSLTVEEIATKGGLTEGITAQYVGQQDEKKRKRFEQMYLHYPTLLTLKWVQQVPGKPRRTRDGKGFTETLGPAEYKISALGRKAIEGKEGQEVLAKVAEWDKEGKGNKKKVAKKKKAA